MNDAGRVAVAEMILEIRDLQARLKHLAIDEAAVELRNSLQFAIGDLETSIRHLLPTVATKP
jgi:hypothetical protein